MRWVGGGGPDVSNHRQLGTATCAGKVVCMYTLKRQLWINENITGSWIYWMGKLCQVMVWCCQGGVNVNETASLQVVKDDMNWLRLSWCQQIWTTRNSNMCREGLYVYFTKRTVINKWNHYCTMNLMDGLQFYHFLCLIRNLSRYVPNQWETLHCNNVSHWLGRIPRLIPAKHTESWTKWPPFGRHLQMHFRERKLMYFEWKVSELCF